MSYGKPHKKIVWPPSWAMIHAIRKKKKIWILNMDNISAYKLRFFFYWLFYLFKFIDNIFFISIFTSVSVDLIFIQKTKIYIILKDGCLENTRSHTRIDSFIQFDQTIIFVLYVLVVWHSYYLLIVLFSKDLYVHIFAFGEINFRR